VEVEVELENEFKELKVTGQRGGVVSK